MRCGSTTDWEGLHDSLSWRERSAVVSTCLGGHPQDMLISTNCLVSQGSEMYLAGQEVLSGHISHGERISTVNLLALVKIPAKLAGAVRAKGVRCCCWSQAIATRKYSQCCSILVRMASSLSSRIHNLSLCASRRERWWYPVDIVEIGDQ